MKKALIVKLAMAFVVAISASSWAQEVQPSPSDTAAPATTVQGAVIAQPIPMAQVPMAVSDCGCNQTMTAAPIQQYATAGCAGCSGCTNCVSGCGTIGQVGYNEPIQTGSPVVTSAPIGAYGQTPIYSNVSSGCCGQTYAPSYSNASAQTAAPVAWTGDAGCGSCNTCQPAPCNTCNSCDPCAQQQQKKRGLFGGRMLRRNAYQNRNTVTSY